MNRPFQSRARRAHTSDSARRAGHSSLGLMLLLGVLLAGVVGARIGWQEGEAAEAPPVQTNAGEEAAETELTKEERDRRNHLKVMVRLQEDAVANIDLMTPAQRAKHDGLATAEEQLTYLVQLEIVRVRARGKRLLSGLGDRGSEIYGTLNELPAERRNGHMRKLQNTLSNEYRDSIEKFGDEAGLDSRSIKNAQKARARGRRISWLAEFEQKRLREMRGNGTLPAGMDQATFDRLVAEDDPTAFLRGLNTSRLDPPSELGDARDPEAGNSGNVPLSNLTDGARPPRTGLNEDGPGEPVRVEPGEGGESSASGGSASQRPGDAGPGKSPRNPRANGERPEGTGDRDGAQAPRNGANADVPDDSGSAERNARPEGVGDREGGGNGQRNDVAVPADAQRDGARAGDPQRAGQARPDRGDGVQRAGDGEQRGEVTPQARPMLTGRESFLAADKLGQLLNKNPDLAKLWAEELGGAARGATPQERLTEYNDMAVRLRELLAESLPADLLEQSEVDRIQDAYLVVAALGAGGVDVTADARLLDQVATVEERASARAAAAAGEQGNPPGETVVAADPSIAAPNRGEANGAEANRVAGNGALEGGAPEGGAEPEGTDTGGNAASGDDLAASNVPPVERPGEQPGAGAAGAPRADGKLSMAESRQEAQNLAAILGQIPQQARALAVELGGVEANEPQKRLAQFRAKAPKLRQLLGEAGLTPEALAKYKVDQVQDVFLVIAVLGAGGLDVSRDEAYLDQLISAAERRNAESGDVARAGNGAGDSTPGESAGEPARPQGNPGGARTNPGRTERAADPNAGRGANAPEGGGNAGASFAELRQAAEQERQALLKQLEGRPTIAADLAEVARFTEEDLALTRELPPAEGLRRRYEIAAERVVRKALDGKLMTPDRVDSIFSYEPGFLPLTVRQAAGEDVERDLKRLRQLSAEVNANSALSGAGVPGAGEAQPEGEAPTGEQPPAGEDAPEMQALSATGERDDGNATASSANDSAQGPAQPTLAPKPPVGLKVDDSSPDVQLPPRPRAQAPTTGSGAPKRGPRIPPHLRNRPSAREQVESMGDRMRSAGTRPSGQSQRERPKSGDDPEEKSGGDTPKGDGQQGQGKPAGSGSAGSTGDRP